MVIKLDFNRSIRFEAESQGTYGQGGLHAATIRPVVLDMNSYMNSGINVNSDNTHCI
jgi:hypothetical protein